MTTSEYREFINWRIASLMSPEPSGSEPIVETEDHDFADPSNHDLDPVTLDTPDTTEDTDDDQDDDWLLDSLTDEDLEHFTMDDLQAIYSAREDYNEKETEHVLQNPPSPPKQSPSRRARQPKTPKWTDHSLVDENGLMDTRQRRRQTTGRRLRRKCNWLRVPALPTRTNSSVPDLIMTSPEGGSYSLHDPMDYE